VREFGTTRRTGKAHLLSALRTRPALALAVSGALALALCAPAGGLGAPAANPATFRIVQDPIGFSMEYPLLEQALGAGPCPPAPLARLFRELGSPPVRIGGDSQDLAGPTSAYHYYVPATFWPVLGCFARETGSQITVGLNFAQSSIEDERATIALAQQNIPAAQLSFSLGNEPDLYGESHPLHSEPGFTVPLERSGSWSAAEYAQQWTSRRDELGAIRLEGPDLAGNTWKAQIAQLLFADPPDQLDAHLYPTSACGVGPPATSARLLNRHSSVEVVKERRWLVVGAQAVHRPAVISEANSASCGGKPGVSDAPVASIWAVRFVLAALLEGFQQVRFHSAGTSYDPFTFNANGSVTPHPLASALYFLHHWIPVGATITSYVPTAPSASSTELFGASITRGRSTSVILTSFAPHPLELQIPLSSSARTVQLDALTLAGSQPALSRLAVSEHLARLQLAPNTVLALKVP